MPLGQERSVGSRTLSDALERDSLLSLENLNSGRRARALPMSRRRARVTPTDRDKQRNGRQKEPPTGYNRLIGAAAFAYFAVSRLGRQGSSRTITRVFYATKELSGRLEGTLHSASTTTAITTSHRTALLTSTLGD